MIAFPNGFLSSQQTLTNKKHTPDIFLFKRTDKVREQIQ